MYSTVHPKGFVLFDMARKVFAKAGLRARELDFEYYAIHDLARSEIFPIYPPIAELFGVPGSYVFKAQNHHISAGVGRFLNLRRYLSECYKVLPKKQTLAHAACSNRQLVVGQEVKRHVCASGARKFPGWACIDFFVGEFAGVGREIRALAALARSRGPAAGGCYSTPDRDPRRAYCAGTEFSPMSRKKSRMRGAIS